MNTASTIFQSLATVIKEEDTLDDVLVEKAIDFLKAISPYESRFHANDLLFGLVPEHDDPVIGFIEALWSLVAFSDHRIVGLTAVVEQSPRSCSENAIVHFSNTGRNPECPDAADAAKHAQMNNILFERVIVPSEAYIRSLCS
ncbi:hypothetical protein BLNAU_7850 [Blattamonas nauphoetae]|uniref:Uncharacterized protein n=1 Tax=Blattamonas nauphoetae TaxID=2049346 RepID=A0ABQ9Y0I3_9EUKA|nr:hypothetical protein BLNAU_7850 [Blattamonas nauphoetae]